MAQQIFVNLPVKSLRRSMTFFTAVGYAFNMKFTDENAACMVIGENIYVMLLSEPFFQRFTQKDIADAKKTTEVLVGLTCESRAEVDERLGKALAAGGKETRDPQDHGFMYARAFEDPDGHIWELFWMDPASKQSA
jgi:predicted lactoylglutathione lyase